MLAFLSVAQYSDKYNNVRYEIWEEVIIIRILINGNIYEPKTLLAYTEKLVKIDDEYQIISKESVKDTNENNCLRFTGETPFRYIDIRNLPNYLVREVTSKLLMDGYYDFDTILIFPLQENELEYYKKGMPFFESSHVLGDGMY